MNSQNNITKLFYEDKYLPYNIRKIFPHDFDELAKTNSFLHHKGISLDIYETKRLMVIPCYHKNISKSLIEKE